MDKKDIAMGLDMRFGDFGVRHACVIGRDTSTFSYGDTLDFVRYMGNDDGGESHYVVGKWRPDNEGYRFESVGNRLFDCVEAYEVAEIWSVLKSVQSFLDGLYSG